MKITIATILVFILNTIFCMAQPIPKPAVNHEGKYAYIATEYIYENALPFNNYEAAVKQNGKWFFINEDFEPITPFTDTIDFRFGKDNYSEIKLMKNGDNWFLYDTWNKWQSDSFLLLKKDFLPWKNVVVTETNQKQHLLNIRNHKISPVFDSLIMGPDWRKRFWAVSNNQTFRINSRTEELEESFDFVEPLIPNMHIYAYKQNGTWNIRTGKRNKLRKNIPETDIYLFPEYELYMIKKREIPYVNTGYRNEGLKKIKLTDSIATLHEGDDAVGLWHMLLHSDSSRILFKREKYGFMDMHLNIIIPTQYDFVYEFFGRSHTAVKIGDKWSLIDRQGNIISKTSYNFLSPETEELYIAQKDELFGIINSDEEIMFPFYCSYIKKSTHGFIVRYNGNTGVIDEHGKEIIPIEYTSLVDMHTGWIEYEKDGLKGIYDLNTGKKILEGYFNKLKRIGNDYIYHIDGNKKELITSTGEVLISGKYAEIIDLNNGFFGLRKGYKEYYVGSTYTIYNANEKKIIPGEYEYVGRFNEGLINVSDGRRYGFINKEGNIVIPFKYNYAASFYNGKATVQKWPIYFNIDHDGHKINIKKIKT